MRKLKNIMWVVALIILIVLIGIIAYGYYRNATMEVTRPVATMEVENFGTIKFELYPEYAPETVANFITLANRGFYDGLTFHRIVADFMIQGGDKNGDGSGLATTSDLMDDGDDTEYTIKGEFIANGVDNQLQFDEGVVGMARSDYTSYSSSLTEDSYNSGSSQFFIMTADNTSLNGQYTAFGKVIEGMDIVHQIEAVEVTTSDDDDTEESTPVDPPVITSIRVETNGIDYGLPETLEPFDYMTWLYKQYGLDTNSLTTLE